MFFNIYACEVRGVDATNNPVEIPAFAGMTDAEWAVDNEHSSIHYCHSAKAESKERILNPSLLSFPRRRESHMP